MNSHRGTGQILEVAGLSPLAFARVTSLTQANRAGRRAFGDPFARGDIVAVELEPAGCAARLYSQKSLNL